MKSLLAALQFLTVIPVRVRGELKPEDLGKSLLYFPLVGFAIGGLLALASVSLAFLPSAVRGSAIIILSVLLTGGLHLDGLADACDGFFGHNPRGKILAVMKDSRVGAMGAAGIVSVLILKFSIYASLPGEVLWKALILSAVFSRWIQAAACAGASYAREEGTGRDFVGHASLREAIPGFFLAGFLFVLFFGIRGPAVFFASAIPAFFAFLHMRQRIGGMTGDTVGALNEIAEASVLFFTVVLT